jgi:hypothetical protein
MDIRPRNMGKQLDHNVFKYILSTFHQILVLKGIMKQWKFGTYNLRSMYYTTC